MKSFSQRKGIKPVKSVMQIDSMDSDLRIGLWNALTLNYWDRGVNTLISDDKALKILLKSVWRNYFKKPIDTIDNFWVNNHAEIRKYFFNCEWNEVYDFIEFIANNFLYEYNEPNPEFIDSCNSVLTCELSAYRFVGDKIAQITSEEEVSEIEEALKISTPLKAVNTHIKRALDLLADRKSPDYRNSIKESISAVESICNLIMKKKTATLGQALKKIEEKVELHPALKSAFKSLYGYTSNEEGIRHALIDESNLSFEDAKFMLVSCSAFINYLISKASKTEIKI